MVWVVGYIVALVGAASLFTWFGVAERWPSALGVLVGMAGAQLTLMQRLPMLVGLGMSAIGTALIARDFVRLALAQGSVAQLARVRLPTHRRR